MNIIHGDSPAAKRIADALERIATGLEEILKRDDEFDYKVIDINPIVVEDTPTITFTDSDPSPQE